MRTLPRRQLAVFLLINIVCIVLAVLHAKHYGYGQTPFDALHHSRKAIIAGYRSVAAEISWVSLLLLGVFAIVVGIWKKVPHTKPVILLMAGSIALIGVLSCSQWVQLNGFHIRYFLTCVIAFISCVSYFVAAVCLPFLRTQGQYLGSLAVLLAIEYVFALHGMSPDYSQLVNEAWRARSRAVAGAVIANKANLVIGDFWDVWPSVFNAIALSSNHGIYGAAWRGGVLTHRIQRLSVKEHGLRALCFYDTASICEKQAAQNLRANASIIPGTTNKIMVDGKPMLIMTMTVGPLSVP